MPSTSQFFLPTQPVSTTSKGRTATTTTNGRGRSSSFASTLKKILPGNRAERGGTLRKRGYHASLEDASIPAIRCTPSISQGSRGESSDRLVRWNTAIDLTSSAPATNSSSFPGTRSQELYLERREKRRQRRSLKESGDYLGVQGINPSTGEMDVLTPSSSSAGSQFRSLARAVQARRAAYERARRALRSEKMRKWEMDKEALKAERRRKVRWTKNGSAWSSAVEPDLSPIEGSSAASTPRAGEESTETVVRTPSVRQESGDYFGRSESHDEAETEMEEGALSMSRLATTLPASLTSCANHVTRRKPVSSEACLPNPYKPIPRSSKTSRNTIPSQESYRNIISVESDFPPELPPKVGLKPEG